jgi:D-alanyl-lipoteichoic acid acyltransferase DltB (MBOAT superfamily)
MLFNSPEFLFWFLPITVAGFFVFGHFRLERIAVAWLVFASLFFYAWWRFDYLVILAGSIVFNYAIGRRLIERPSGLLLGVGVGANLLVLGYFKYSLFLADNVNWMFGTSFSIGAMLLPLGISFFTFQQIAYLIDCKSGITTEKNLLNYSLFVSFFPQLIAGPIVHHKEMLPQFKERSTFKPNLENIVIGLSIFGIGLFKKVVIADRIAVYATEAFNAALTGATLTFVEAWAAALTFTLQLYFDFSGYSDMAIGLALIFGVRIPINFNSPFKAVSIIEFWQRWHMTLTRFLTMYLYNPIVMTLTRRRLAAGKPLLQRKSTSFGPFVVLLVFPTMFTMFWAGVWHGAGYQYLIFGVLHGSYIVLNHAWRLLRRSFDIVGPTTARLMRPFGVLLTFCAVVVSLVFFRAETVPQAMSVLEGMAGLNGVYIPAQWQRLLGPVNAIIPSWIEFAWIPYVRTSQVGILGLLMLVVWFCPNTQGWIAGNVGASRSTGIFARTKQFAVKFQPGRILYGWSPSPTAAVWVGLLISLSILEIVSEAPSEFLYFNF